MVAAPRPAAAVHLADGILPLPWAARLLALALLRAGRCLAPRAAASALQALLVPGVPLGALSLAGHTLARSRPGLAQGALVLSPKEVATWNGPRS